MNYSSEHNLYPLDPGILYGGIDTIWVNEPLAFDQISEFLNISKEEIEFLNPIFKSGIIPAYNGKTYSLRLPKDQALKFAENEQSIYNYKSKSGMEKEKLVAEIKKATDRQYHTVRSGESLGLIARKYNVSVKQLQQWNGMKGTMIHPGQQLVVFPPSNYAYAPSSSNPSSKQTSTSKQTSSATTAAPANSTPANASAEFHYVKSGENLAMIAQQYGCSVENLKTWNDLSNNTIYPKQKLKVSGETAVARAAESKPAPASANTENKYVYYTVKKGDNLWDIAQQYKGVSVDDIKKWNNMGNSSKLQVGQKLKIGKNG